MIEQSIQLMFLSNGLQLKPRKIKSQAICRKTLELRERKYIGTPEFLNMEKKEMEDI